MNKCETCKCNKVCDHNHFGFENCDNYISVDCVEVVRCRDCRFFETEMWDKTLMCGCTNYSGLQDVKPDGYCCYGKRKEGTE